MTLPKKVNILGTEYKIIYETNEQNEKLIECRGYVEFFTKEIHIDKEYFDKNSLKSNFFSDLYKMGFKTLRHEIIHCFIFESGLWNNCSWADNEELTDWIAIQIPKLSKCFKELKIMEEK